MDNTKQYVVLEHLMLPDRGFRFFSTNCRWKGRAPEDVRENDNNTHGYTGEQWYEEVGFADTVEEAQGICAQMDSSKIATWDELYDYHREQSEKRDEELKSKLDK